MIAIDPQAPLAEEHAAEAITKVRYMTYRDRQSSSSQLGFRVEGLKVGLAPALGGYLQECRAYLPNIGGVGVLVVPGIDDLNVGDEERNNARMCWVFGQISRLHRRRKQTAVNL